MMMIMMLMMMMMTMMMMIMMLMIMMIIDSVKLPCDPPLAVLCQDLGTSCSPMYRCVAIHSNILFTHSTSAQIIARVQNSKY